MPFAECLTPPLTSLRVAFAETGEQAVNLLLRSIAGEPLPGGPVLLPGGPVLLPVELIVRASCRRSGPGSASPPRSPLEAR